MEKKLRAASICVQGGYEPKNGEPIEVPIIQSTTFKYDNSEEMAMLFDLKKEFLYPTPKSHQRCCSQENSTARRRCGSCIDK